MTTPWQPLDLLMTADELTGQLRRAAAAGDWLDAYLLAAGLHQLVEDRLHPDPLLLRRAADYLHGRGARAGGLVAGAAARLLQAPVPPALHATRRSLGEATISLAAAVLGNGPAGHLGLDELRLPRTDDVLRVPSCFRSFDQHPDDIAELAGRFVDRFGTGTPVCVVGIRTSGSYLAPLCVAALRARSVTASLLSYRPGRGLRREERGVLREVAAAGGHVVLVDDPPVTGSALAAAATAIGLPEDRIVMLLALAGQNPPPALEPWAGVYLPWSEWTVHSRLREPAVAAQLESLLGPGHLVEARAVPWQSGNTRRSRARARYTVRITGPDGTTRPSEIAVEGAGLGYFGRHAVTVANRLPQHCPRTYGLADGLLYREWLPAALKRPDEQVLAAGVVRYVSDRGRALRVDRDPVARLRGRAPVWEVAAGLLSGMFGRLAPAGQVLLLDGIVRGLLRTTAPSVPDGQTDVRFWLPGDQLRKVGFDERSFGSLELGCYDEIFDLAGASADPPSPGFEAMLRTTYERRTGRTVDGERWLIYRLAHLWRMRRAGDLHRQRADDLSATAVCDYLASALDATGLDGGGELCAIDLDGTLETDPLGFPNPSPAGVLALRALATHGFRPILATGRSLPEAAARCTAFGLRGAVAEYGAVSYDHRSHRSTDLRSTSAGQAIEFIRCRLAALPDVRLDDRYRYVVRASHSSGGPLPDDILQQLGAELLAKVRIVPGDGQTDIVPIGVDKGTGLREFASSLDPQRSRPPGFALAVGDTAEDVSMFGLAHLARAPRNAAPAVRDAGFVIAAGEYQSGLAEACTELLGHGPGECDRCRGPEVPSRSAVMLAILGLREDGLRGLPVRTARLAVLAARRSRW